MSLEHVMIEGVETAGPNTTVEALAMQMQDANVGSIVVENEMEPIGIVTDRDVALQVGPGDHEPSDLLAEDVMSVDPVTVPVSANLLDATARMRENTVRRLPVVDAEGLLVGILALDDVLVLLAQEIANVGNVVAAESPPY